ncbi:MAG: tetraacyldisaccharide 4'-kinase [Burkholderiales bacterium]|nr:tetraacyldisaccharide 4'-kinase [Burkholderiales bacterium]
MGDAAPRSTLEPTLQRIWTHRVLAAWLLLIVAIPYQWLTFFRRTLYRVGVFNIARIPVPVVVVGNVVAGGAGKTPTVIALVQHLQFQGHAVGVISRGYGRKSDQTLEVLGDASAHDTGDEPLLIKRKTGASVFVGQTRVLAARALLAQHPETTVIVCDDGLQHYGLYRDLEVCVFDDRGVGNGWLLPAGPLRESWPRRPLAQAGQANARLLVLHTGSQPQFGGFTAQRFLADHAVRSDGSVVALDVLAHGGGKPLMAVAAIAQPESFFTMLRQRGLAIASTQALPDHYDFDSWLCKTGEGYQLVCTEKDAAKLWKRAPDALAIPLVQTMGSDFWTAMDQQLAAVSSTKLSSSHGHKTS